MNLKYMVRLSTGEPDACQQILKPLKESSQKFRRAQIPLNVAQMLDTRYADCE